MALLSYIAYCGKNNKGDTVEIIVGTQQEIVDGIADRRKRYGGDLRIVNFDIDQWSGDYACLIEYRIEYL